MSGQREGLIPPAQQAGRMYAVRLGKILSSISVLFAAVAFAAIASWLLVILIVVLGVMILICTLGGIIAVIPDYLEIITSGPEAISDLSQAILSYWPVFTPIAVVLSVASIPLLLLDRNERHTKRIVYSAAVALVSIVCMILLAAGVHS